MSNPHRRIIFKIIPKKAKEVMEKVFETTPPPSKKLIAETKSKRAGNPRPFALLLTHDSCILTSNFFSSPLSALSFQLCYLDRELGFSEAHKKLLEKAWGYIQRVFPVNRSKGIIMLFRLGYAPLSATRAPRRAINDVFLD